MNRIIKSLSSVVTVATLVAGCQSDLVAPVDQDSVISTISEQKTSTVSAEGDRTALAKLLAKAMSDPEIRGFLHAEAAKQFNKDYDVLLATAKTQPLPVTGQLFVERLGEIYGSQEAVEAMLEADPLVTLFEPQINANQDQTSVPLVALAAEQGEIRSYDTLGNLHLLLATQPPTQPVYVLKTNERVVTADKGTTPPRQLGRQFTTIDGQRFHFASDAFDPNVSSGYGGTYTIPDDLIAVYEDQKGCDPCVFRDQLYYGIKEDKLSGTFSDQYVETIPKLWLTNPAAYLKLGGWTDGAFEIAFTMLYTESTAEEPPVLKNNQQILSIQPEQLFEFDAFGRPTKVKLYTLENPIQYDSWNMRYWGDRSKFVVEEQDPGVGLSQTITHTTTVGKNFSLTIGTVSPDSVVKEGFGLGYRYQQEQAVTKTATTVYTTTQAADYLGEATFYWTLPVIAGSYTNTSGREEYYEYALSTGTIAFPLVPLRK